MNPVFHIVLYHPEIPPNTGNIGRLCLGIGAALHLVHPISFDIDEKAVRRAGLDYWKHVNLFEHADEAAFWAWAEGRCVYLLSKHGQQPYSRIPFQRGDVLVFGKETKGLPTELVAERGAYSIPMTGPIRSLNLSNAAAVVAYAALQAVSEDLF